MTHLLNAHRSVRGTATRPTILTLGLVAASLAVAPSAASAASWSATGALPAGPDAREPVVAAKPDAPGAAAAWVSEDRVFTSTIGAIGGWSPARPLSPAGVYSTTPAVDHGTLGRVVVAWTQVDGGHQRVAVSTRRLLGTWSPAVFVSPAGLDARQVKAVIGRGGNADLAWVQSGPTGVAAVGTATASVGLSTPTWRSGTLTTPSSRISSLALTVGRGGNDSVRAAWDDEAGVRTASRTASGTWGTTTSFEAGSNPRVAVDAQGRDTVTFETPVGITAKRRSTGATWTTSTVPGSEQFRNELGGQFNSDVSLQVKPNGTAQVYFLQTSFGGEIYANKVQRATLPLSGQGSVGTLATSQDQLRSLSTGMDDAGNDLAYWNTYSDETGESTLTSAGSLAGPAIANLSGAPPVVDAAGNGNAVLAWNTNPGLGYAIRR